MLHSSYHFGEPSLIPKLLIPALCIYDIYYDYAVLLLISLLLYTYINQCNLYWNEAL